MSPDPQPTQRERDLGDDLADLLEAAKDVDRDVLADMVKAREASSSGPPVRVRCCGIIWEHGAFSQARPCHDCPERGAS